MKIQEYIFQNKNNITLIATQNDKLIDFCKNKENSIKIFHPEVIYDYVKKIFLFTYKINKG